MKGSPRLIVFDCDGTLVDSQHMIGESMRRAFASVGRPLPALDEVRNVIGLALEHAVQQLVPDAGEEERATLVRVYRESFFELRSTSAPEPLYPGCRECLVSLAQDGDLLAVATGKGRRGLTTILQAHGLLDFFASLKTADDGPGKPNPRILLDAMDECGVEPRRTLMIGDTSFDVEMARNAGALPIGVAWGYHPPERLRALGALAIAEDFAGLPRLIEVTCPRSGC